MSVIIFNLEELRKNARVFFKKEDITNGDIAKYMFTDKENGGLGLSQYRSSIYRKLRTSDIEFTLTLKDNERKDISYTDKAKLVQEYLFQNKYSCGDRITYGEILNISKICGANPRQVCVKFLRVDEANALNLINGKSNTVSIMPNGKYDELSLKEKVEKVRAYFSKKLVKRLYSSDEIKEIASKFDIPQKCFIVNILNKDASTYERMKRGEIKGIRYEGELPEYENPQAKFIRSS